MAQNIRNQIIGAASSVFLIPSFVLTVIPTLSKDPGMAACMALGVIGLPFIPFALRRCKEPGALPILIVLGAMLLAYNFQNALDALNGSHAMATGAARSRMTDAAAFNEKISELNVRKRDVEAHKTISRDAAQAAQEQRDHECGNGNGPKCRDLDSKLSAIKHDRGLTERAENIERDLDKAHEDLRALGAVEKSADPTATQLASIIGWFWHGAEKHGDDISANRPIFKAIIVEMMGGLMPWVLVTIFGMAPAAAKPKPRLRKGQKPADKESILKWAGARIVKREGRSVRAGVAFADYEAWCASNGLAPVNIQIWGRVMKGELGFRKEGGDKRTSYIGIGLKGNLTLIPQKSPRKTGDVRADGDAAARPVGS